MSALDMIVTIHQYDFRESTCLFVLVMEMGYENCDLLGYYAASSGNCVPTFRDNP